LTQPLLEAGGAWQGTNQETEVIRMFLTEQEARQYPTSVNWKAAMDEFHARSQELKDSGKFALVYTNGYVMLKDGNVVWHGKV